MLWLYHVTKHAVYVTGTCKDFVVPFKADCSNEKHISSWKIDFPVIGTNLSCSEQLKLQHYWGNWLGTFSQQLVIDMLSRKSIWNRVFMPHHTIVMGYMVSMFDVMKVTWVNFWKVCRCVSIRVVVVRRFQLLWFSSLPDRKITQTGSSPWSLSRYSKPNKPLSWRESISPFSHSSPNFQLSVHSFCTRTWVVWWILIILCT